MAKLLMPEMRQAGASGSARGSALAYRSISQGRIIHAHPATDWRWVQATVNRAEELGALAPGKRVRTHTLRNSYARHLLMNGISIYYLSRWLGTRRFRRRSYT